MKEGWIHRKSSRGHSALSAKSIKNHEGMNKCRDYVNLTLSGIMSVRRTRHVHH